MLKNIDVLVYLPPLLPSVNSSRPAKNASVAAAVATIPASKIVLSRNGKKRPLLKPAVHD